jgi:hypothetical protein
MVNPYASLKTLVGRYLVSNTPKTQAVAPYSDAGRLKKLPPVPPPSAYAETAYNLSRLTPLEQQTLMNWLYKTNFVCQDMVRMVVNPVVGQGFGVQYVNDTPTIQRIVDRYRTFNKLHTRTEIKALTRSYVLTGEALQLAAPYGDTWFTVHAPSILIHQTLLDPRNPQEIIGVLLKSDGYTPGVTYKTAIDESRLSPEALAMRRQWPNWCFYLYNDEVDEILDAPNWIYTDDLDRLLPDDCAGWTRKQRRGTPMFYAWSDLFNQLVEVLWAFLDKSKSYGAWNYKFQINTGVTDFAESVQKVKLWQDAIGTPELNSAIYTDHNVDVQPMAFNMYSADMERILDVMLQMSGMSANIPMYDMGSTQHTPYATAKAQGSPKEQFLVSVQTDIEEFLEAQYTFVLADAQRRGQIPREELQRVQEAI